MKYGCEEAGVWWILQLTLKRSSPRFCHEDFPKEFIFKTVFGVLS